MTVLTMSAAEITKFDTLMRLDRGEIRTADAMELLGLQRRQISGCSTALDRKALRVSCRASAGGRATGATVMPSAPRWSRWCEKTMPTSGREIHDPQRVRTLDLEAAVDLVERAQCLVVGNGGDAGFPAPDTGQPHRLHQPLDRAFGDGDALAQKLPPHLARPVQAETHLMDAPDVPLQLVVPPGASRSPARIGKARGMLMIRGRGDRQFPADRLDPQLLSMRVDERHRHRPWRSSSS